MIKKSEHLEIMILSRLFERSRDYSFFRLKVVGITTKRPLTSKAEHIRGHMDVRLSEAFRMNKRKRG